MVPIPVTESFGQTQISAGATMELQSVINRTPSSGGAMMEPELDMIAKVTQQRVMHEDGVSLARKP